MISCFDMLLKELYDKYFIQPETDDTKITEKQIRRDSLMITIKNLDEITKMREL